MLQKGANVFKRNQTFNQRLQLSQFKIETP